MISKQLLSFGTVCRVHVRIWSKIKWVSTFRSHTRPKLRQANLFCFSFLCLLCLLQSILKFTVIQSVVGWQTEHFARDKNENDDNDTECKYWNAFIKLNCGNDAIKARRCDCVLYRCIDTKKTNLICFVLRFLFIFEIKFFSSIFFFDKTKLKITILNN